MVDRGGGRRGDRLRSGPGEAPRGDQRVHRCRLRPRLLPSGRPGSGRLSSGSTARGDAACTESGMKHTHAAGTRKEPIKPESVEEQTKHILEEARMVIPGVRALFGFQLIAVFNEPFFERLGGVERGAHLAALALVLVALASIMCPAAYHRQAEPRSTSDAFNRFASRCLTVGMFVLMLGVNVDFYLVATSWRPAASLRRIRRSSTASTRSREGRSTRAIGRTSRWTSAASGSASSARGLPPFRRFP